MAYEKGTSTENRGSGKRRKIAPSDDGSNMSDGESVEAMSVCEGENRQETTASLIKLRLKAAKKKFRDGVGKTRTVMKFDMTIEERICEIFSVVAKEMAQDMMDDIWRVKETRTEDVRTDLCDIKKAMEIMMAKVEKLEIERVKPLRTWK
ncbi:hypothetical protein RUM44_007536 [Polyplax serrata]|uniref:Uncharacterized protein n=1 Tax=Polyplax serrata TaxID=468196 RepID=A0ABR1B6X9_POLSC